MGLDQALRRGHRDRVGYGTPNSYREVVQSVCSVLARQPLSRRCLYRRREHPLRRLA